METQVVRLPDVVPVARFSDASVRLAEAVLELRRAGRDLQPLAHVLADNLGNAYASMLLGVIGSLNAMASIAHAAVESAR